MLNGLFPFSVDIRFPDFPQHQQGLAEEFGPFFFNGVDNPSSSRI
jgi:hypothetical protein